MLFNVSLYLLLFVSFLSLSSYFLFPFSSICCPVFSSSVRFFNSFGESAAHLPHPEVQTSTFVKEIKKLNQQAAVSVPSTLASAVTESGSHPSIFTIEKVSEPYTIPGNLTREKMNEISMWNPIAAKEMDWINPLMVKKCYKPKGLIPCDLL